MAKAKQQQVFETVFNTYSLESVIGEGGAGRVWRAADSTGQRVAVKVLSVERATTERRKRFQNEIVFCERAKHPNIVEIIDRGLAQTDAGATPFYVMPLLDGSLRECLADTADIAKRLSYFDQLLSGVEAAHLQRVIHRDLKPENVLYKKANDLVVVADFGIAHFTDEELYTAVETAPNARLANFAYSAPEQRTRGRATDARTDIYALGLILNEMFTGEVPHGTGFKTITSVAPEYGWVDEHRKRDDAMGSGEATFVDRRGQIAVFSKATGFCHAATAIRDPESGNSCRRGRRSAGARPATGRGL